MTNFILSPAAQADLDNIWNYTTKNWGEAQAERYTRDIEAACIGLATGNQISQSAKDIRAGYRKPLIGSHVLFFKVLKDGTIDIIRILHQRMDISRRFIPKEVIVDPFDGNKSVHSARRSRQRDAGYRTSAATTPMGGFGPAKPGFLCPLEQRYFPLVVI